METVLNASVDHVRQLLTQELPAGFLYHSLSHTQSVVEKSIELAKGHGLNEEDTTILQLAAWFHDVGYIHSIEHHESESAKMANDFLESQGVDKATIEAIVALIMATEVGYSPSTLLEQIISDADCAHLGSKSFSEQSALLRKEWEITQDKVYTDVDWIEENINFLTTHKYKTALANSEWGKTKGKNLARLLRTKDKLHQEKSKLNHKKEELSFKKGKVALPERGIETMFRVALRNHITLSDIADTKANILLSVNAIIVSLALSNLLPKLDNPSNQYLIIPSLIFIAVTVVSMVLSVLATRPNVTKGKFTKDDVANKKVNLLFFGNFHQMKLDEFEWAMHEMMKDRDYLYGSLTKDLYFLGLVLNRKYNLLRVTYTVFMIGMILSVIAFALAFYYGGGQ